LTLKREKSLEPSCWKT